jgi:hypothetical protein
MAIKNIFLVLVCCTKKNLATLEPKAGQQQVAAKNGPWHSWLHGLTRRRQADQKKKKIKLESLFFAI